MATKTDIKQQFRSEVVAAVDGLVNNDNVVLSHPNMDENLPAVAYQEQVIEEPNTGVNIDRTGDEYDDLGNLTKRGYVEYVELQFDTYILADSETVKDDIYEAVRRRFNRYSMDDRPWEFHADVKNIDVNGTFNADRTDDDETTRGDNLEIVIKFKRRQKFEV